MTPTPIVLTPGRLARLLAVSVRMVTSWCDRGLLACYRLPPSQDRRIRLTDALRLAREWNLPTEGLDELARRHDLAPAAPPQVLLITPSSHVPTELGAACSDVAIALDPFQAGSLLTSRRFDAVVIDHAIGGVEARRICRWMADHRSGTPVACLLNEDETGKPRGAMLARQKPADLAILLADLLATRAS